jgi:hypothetical protein
MEKNDLHSDYVKFIKNTTKGAESIMDRAIRDVKNGIPNIEDKKTRDFCKKSLDDILSGNVEPMELINKIKNL